MNDNAYKLDLPKGYNVSPTFNVRDLMPYLEDGVRVEDGADLRANLFQQGGRCAASWENWSYQPKRRGARV